MYRFPLSQKGQAAARLLNLTLCPKVKHNVISSGDTEMPLSTLGIRRNLNVSSEPHMTEAQCSVLMRGALSCPDVKVRFISFEMQLHFLMKEAFHRGIIRHETSYVIV